MATRYLWSGATGTGDGSSWTDAYTTESAAYAALSAGDVLLKAKTHSETSTGSSSISAAGPTIPSFARVIVVDKDTGLYSPQTSSPTVAHNGVTRTGNLQMFGDYLKANNTGLGSITLANEVDAEDTIFELNGSLISDAYCRKAFKRCTFKYQAYSSSTKAFMVKDAVIDDCVFITAAKGTYDDGLIRHRGYDSFCQVEFRGTDFSQVATTMPLIYFSDNYIAFRPIFKRCKFASGATLMSSPNLPYLDGEEAIFYACDFGNGYPESRFYGYRGNVLSDTSVYLSGTDGYADAYSDVAMSQRFDPASNNASGPHLVSFDIEGYAEVSGNKVFTVEALENFTAALTKSQVWLELDLFESNTTCEFAGATNEVKLSSTALGSSGATWTGAPGGSRAVQIQITANVARPGPIKARVHVRAYEASKSVWVNPKVKIEAAL